MSLEKQGRVFVAGGSGMVGSAIIRRLLASGYTNICSNYNSTVPDTASRKSIAFFQLDLRRQADTEVFFKKERPDYVFLAAAKVGGILANNTYKADFIYDNIAIAGNVVNSSYRYGVKKLLNLGSSCIYPRLAPQPMKEEYLLAGALEPTNEPYALAKIAAIKLCRYFNEQYGTNFISVMPPNLYGPNDNFNLETAHVPPALMRKFHLSKLLMEGDNAAVLADLKRFPVGFGLDDRIGKNDKEIISVLDAVGVGDGYVTVWGSGAPYREFLYVDDLADAVVYLFERYDYQEIGEFVNIGTGRDLMIRELALLIKEVVGFKGKIRHDLTKHDGMPKKLLDVSRAGRLGWQARTSVADGLREMYSWYCNQAR
jgi:GDP-L-fucose synthase